MRRSLSPWIQALCEVASAEQATINEETIGFYLGHAKCSWAMHKDAIKPGQKVLICDDLLATGGTVRGNSAL
ncbi:Adenine phosphoribosyltransferase [Lysinibacillus sphaericus]